MSDPAPARTDADADGDAESTQHPIRASFLRHLARDRITKPLRVSGHADLADAMRDELLRFANAALQQAAVSLRDESTTRRHVVTAEDMNAALLQIS